MFTLFILLAVAPLHAQDRPPAAAPAVPPPAPASAPTAAAPAAEPKITSVSLLSQTSSTVSSGTTAQEYVLEIVGTGFGNIANMDNASVAVLPQTIVSANPITTLSRSADGTKIFAEFTASTGYTLQGITLSTGSNLLPFI